MCFTERANLPSSLHNQRVRLVAIQIEDMSGQFASDIPPL